MELVELIGLLLLVPMCLGLVIFHLMDTRR